MQGFEEVLLRMFSSMVIPFLFLPGNRFISVEFPARGAWVANIPGFLTFASWNSYNT
jgi:hypothetical protein